MADRGSGRAVELYLLRHADAGDPETWTGPEAERPLSERGQRQAERLGSFLRSIGFHADAVLTSPKLRASQTAELVASALGLAVSDEERLAGGVTLEEMERILRDAGDPARALLVGHDPDFSEIVEALLGGPGVPLRKGALARIDADRPLTDGGGTLRWLVPPDLLKNLR
jgi:phosphohistidine phosphatase